LVEGYWPPAFNSTPSRCSERFGLAVVPAESPIGAQRVRQLLFQVHPEPVLDAALLVDHRPAAMRIAWIRRAAAENRRTALALIGP
jgi:hypothetical protein